MTTIRTEMAIREGAVYRYVNRRIVAGLDVPNALDTGVEIAEFMLMAELIDDVTYNRIVDALETMMTDYACIVGSE